MRKVHENYLKNLFSLLMVGVLFYFLLPFVGLYILLPASFGVLSFIDFRTNQRKPEYLFGLKESNDFFKDRRGAWLLLKLPVMLLGFLFDLIVWILHGVLVFFYFLSDVFILLRDLLYWIFYALLWFLRLFIPPLVILYKCIIHYLIKWPWWIYQIAFRSAKLSFYRIFYRIALRGTFLSIFIVLLFYGTGILIDVIPLVFIGIAFAILPLTWSYTEIASLRKRENGIRSYRRVRKLFMNGMISVRAILFYLTAVVVLLVG
jgi:hypothetical protein